MADDSFHLLEKLNQCVVCGETDNLVRFYIVPRTYRSVVSRGSGIACMCRVAWKLSFMDRCL